MDRTPPEINLARLICKKHKISPGFDVRKFAEIFVTIEEAIIPYSIDALFLGLNARIDKPKLILNSQSHYRRQRFTLAHELGHYFIPWHAGLIICHIDPNSRMRNRIYSDMEAEANHFASELLMPKSWISGLIEKSKTIDAIVNEIYNTGVSYIAASIALCRSLPPGCLFIQTDNIGHIEHSGASRGSGVRALGCGASFDPTIYDGLTSEHYVFESGSSRIHWFKFKMSISGKKTKRDFRDSREIINELLDDIEPKKESRVKLLQKINGIIGAANSMHSFDKETEMLSFLHQRFVSNEGLRFLLNHEEFNLFLSKKSEELFLK